MTVIRGPINDLIDDTTKTIFTGWRFDPTTEVWMAEGYNYYYDSHHIDEHEYTEYHLDEYFRKDS